MSYSLGSAVLTGLSHLLELLLFLAEVLILSLTSIDFLKLNLGKAFQLILHFFARISAQSLIELEP